MILAGMVFTSARPISVDGVRLDTLAWNVEKINRASAGRRAADYDVPNMDGVIASLNDPLESTAFGLEMWLRGTDADGSVPAPGLRDTLRNNLDELLHLFGKRHALLEVTEQVSELGGLTNLVRNPSVETNTSLWAPQNLTTQQVAATFGEGSSAMRHLVTTSGTVAYTYPSPTVGSREPVAVGQYVHTTVRIRARRACRIRAGIGFYVGSGASPIAPVYDTRDLATDEVATFQVPNIQNTDASTNGFLFIIYVYQPNTNTNPNWTGESFDLDRAAAYVTPTAMTWPGGEVPYIDGTQLGVEWTGTAHASTSVRRDGTRRCLAKVTDSITPELNTPGSSGRFAVSLVIPSGMWEDAATTDWAGVATGATTTLPVTPLTGSTERVNDGLFVVRGPAVTPRITDPNTGMWVELARTLAAGEDWFLDSGTWVTRYGAGIGFNPTAGNDAAGSVNVGGPGRAYALPLTAIRSGGSRIASVRLTAASGIVAGSTTVFTRTRRKYAA